VNEETCGNCHFARLNWWEVDKSGAELHCRRRSPSVNRLQGRLLVSRMEDFIDDETGRLNLTEVSEPDKALWVVQATGDEADSEGLWPVVTSPDWCGEWRAKRSNLIG